MFGSISCGTMRAEDLIPAFSDTLARLDKAGDYKGLLAEAREISDFASDDAGAVLEELFDALNSFAPDYGYFGAHPGDSADYGFWLSDDWDRTAKDDGVLFVTDWSDVPADYAGGVAHVNDHGNATLAWIDAPGADPREIWSVV
jgi:hypothetical protein